MAELWIMRHREMIARKAHADVCWDIEVVIDSNI